jgi:hypothetical protein
MSDARANAMERGAVRGTRYTIVVRGELDSRFAYLFNGMQMRCVEGTTTLTGQVIDQAQLHGYIERFEELGLELLSVEQMRQPVVSVDERGESDR